MSTTQVAFHADGMHCHGCEHVIEARVGKLARVARVAANYPTETVVVDYDPRATHFDAIRAAVEDLGYRVFEERRPPRPFLARAAIVAASLVALAALILIDTQWISKSGAPDITQHMSLWLIFVLGLLTGFHCIGMCGGFVLGYVAADARAGYSSWASHASYGAGKTLSYTAIGALFGWLGAFIAFTPFLRGAAGVAAGAFLIIFGLNMLGLFAPLRRFRLGLPAPLQNWVMREAGGRHRPFVIGLINGLMIACGPLQAMYVMAAGTGSPVEGAKMLLAFGLGTLPVMLTFGALTAVLSGAVTHRLLKASGLIVVALGAVMINRGLILTGAGADLGSLVARLSHRPAAELPPNAAQLDAQTIEMIADGFGYKPDHFTLVAGKPVKWLINATEITECNKRIVVPALGLEFDLKPGPQTIEFTPRQPGVIPWSCWMGMMRGSFDVVAASAPAQVAPPAQKPDSPSVTLESPSIAPAPPSVTPEPSVTPAPPAKTYVVQRGDTPGKIAKRLFGDATRWREIAAANPGLRPRKLDIGQTLKIP